MAPPDTPMLSATRKCELGESLRDADKGFEYDRASSYNWWDCLMKEGGERDAVVPVERFGDAPLHDVFHHLRAGLKVEVINRDYAKYSNTIGGVFWVAHVLEVAGYKALMRYEGYGTDSSQDFWMNLCCANVHPVGWCANEGKPLVPPKAIQNKEADWKAFLIRRLTGSRTLPVDWSERVKRAIAMCRFKVGDRLELLDRMCSTRVRPAIVKRVVGHRLLVELSVKDRASDEDPDENDSQAETGDWVDQSSALIFPVGWATRSGYNLSASNAYKVHCNRIVDADREGDGSGSAYGSNDARPQQFIFWKERPVNANGQIARWTKGMKLECLDPLDKLNVLAVASVLDVLPGGYLRLGFDGPEIEEDSIAIHSSSPHLFPIGYAETHGVELRPPKGVESNFNWEGYLRQTQAIGAPAEFFDESPAECAFEVGGKLESVDMVEPHLVCVGTVAAKKGRLLQIHFEGWEDSYDQLFDYRSAEIMPLGWCEMMGYKLEAPKSAVVVGNKRKIASTGSSSKKTKH